LPDFETQKVAKLTVGISLVVELSQLYHASWIDTIRSTTLGHLVLGSGFDAIDLLWYIAGVGIGVLSEIGLSRFARKQSSFRT
jgi:hypothetical protein